MPDLATNQAFQFLRDSTWIEDIEPLGGQITDARNELEAQKGCDGEDMIGEAAGVSILFADISAGLIHQQAIEDVRGLAHGRRDGLSGKGAELIGNMGIGFQPRFIAIFGVDQVHCLTLTCGWKELPVAGGGGAATPETGHGQGGLRRDHHGQGAVQRVAFNMPP